MIPSTGVIIPAGGKGTRMGSGPAKQLLSIRGKTVLAHTIGRIIGLEGVKHLVVPTTPDLFHTTRDIIYQCLEQQQKTDSVSAEVIAGGAERMHSVENGLQYLMDTDAELVLIHDAVRPCFPADPVTRVITLALSHGAAILGIPASDTVKIVDSSRQIISTPDRKRVWLAQTPQVFRKNILFEAFQKAEKESFAATDDASLAEFAGYPVYMVEGSRDNIKITYPSDLFFAEKWMNENASI